MTEDLEFSISQYVDGTLSDAERLVLELQLQQDREAQALLAEYRALSDKLASSMAAPEVRWDALARHISQAIDAQEEKAREAYRIPAWIRFASRPLSIAASLLIFAGVGIVAYLHHTAQVSPSIIHPGETQQVASTEILIGPADAEPAHGPAIVEIAVGPTASIKDEPTVVQYSDEVVSRPSSVSIASGVVPAHDTVELPADPIEADMQ